LSWDGTADVRIHDGGASSNIERHVLFQKINDPERSIAWIFPGHVARLYPNVCAFLAPSETMLYSIWKHETFDADIAIAVKAWTVFKVVLVIKRSGKIANAVAKNRQLSLLVGW
jgi:hypothetical protein